MKKLLILLLVFIYSANTTFAAQIILKPNLVTQMSRQEGINKEKRKIDRKISNTEKLKLIKISKTSKTVGASKQLTLKEKVALTKANTANLTIKTPNVVAQITPGVTSIAGVDMNRVRTAWLGLYNSTRQSLGLSPYSYDARLDATAHSWNIEFAKGHGQNHHRRNPGDSYYSYSTITEWFRVRGVEAKIKGGASSTENVGYGYYNCNASDCTDSLINAIHSTYDFYMNEKGKSYDAHYQSIVQPNFTKIGLDIIVVPEERRYYLTVHYITDFE